MRPADTAEESAEDTEIDLARRAEDDIVRHMNQTLDGHDSPISLLSCWRRRATSVNLALPVLMEE